MKIKFTSPYVQIFISLQHLYAINFDHRIYRQYSCKETSIQVLKKYYVLLYAYIDINCKVNVVIDRAITCS